MVDAFAVERDIHGGTAGVADEDFYRSLFAYLAAQKAPAAARQAFGFLHALSVYDFKTASVLADSLYPAAERGASWYPVDDLRDGATIAKLRLGDVDGAMKYWRGLVEPLDPFRGALAHADDLLVHRAGERGSPRPGHGASRPPIAELDIVTLAGTRRTQRVFLHSLEDGTSVPALARPGRPDYPIPE